MLNICFVISSIGGPRMLSSLFSGAWHADAKAVRGDAEFAGDDVAYVVIQRMAHGGLMDVLVECLKEELSRRTLVAGHTLALVPGAIHFLPNERNYSFDGAALVSVDVPGKPKLSLDHLLLGAAALPNPLAVVVLSGLLTDDDGVAGISALHGRGVPVLGTLESHTPVFDMIDQLRRRGAMGELYPPKYLLEHLEFKETHKERVTRKAPPRFLVADDDDGVRGVIGDLLRASGIESDFAADGLDALRKIQKGKYDALFLDLHMPEMDGLRTLEALKTIDPTLPIVVLTGIEDDRLRLAREFKIIDVLPKPFTLEKLKAMLPRLGIA
jgi:CheY-like chemotaxis protein